MMSYHAGYFSRALVEQQRVFRPTSRDKDSTYKILRTFQIIKSFSMKHKKAVQTASTWLR